MDIYLNQLKEKFSFLTNVNYPSVFKGAFDAVCNYLNDDNSNNDSQIKSVKPIMKYSIIKNMIIQNLLFCTLYIIHEIKNHRKWWGGVMDTSKLALFYLKTYHQIRFKKSVITSSDNQKYCIWTPPLIPHTPTLKCKHIWICCPGGMYDLDPAMIALHMNNTFCGSDFICFNNPGISTTSAAKHILPTNPEYLIEYIIELKNKGYFISLIGFSIGSVLALRTLHTINNNSVYKHIKLEAVILVHSPDIVREAIASCSNNWLFRMDIYFAFHVQLLHYQSKSWQMIKDKVNYYWWNGWPFLKQCTEICVNQKWQKLEDEQFNLRNFCDESIMNVPVLRIIAKNDFIIPYEKIDSKYFKYFKEVLITNRGGHCGVQASNETMNKIKIWNLRILDSL